MDSITSYGEKAKSGGPAGEILIRKCLTVALTTPSLFGSGITVALTTATSDETMLSHGSSTVYDMYFFDPWTWAQKGWVLRSFIPPHLISRVFILDFFGSELSYTPAGKGGGIPPPFNPSVNVLTAYPSPKHDVEGSYHGTFLGFYLPPEDVYDKTTKKVEGSVLIWGKSLDYYTNNLSLLQRLSSNPALHLKSVLPAAYQNRLRGLSNVEYLGHLSPQDWLKTMHETHFVLGLKDPLLGPTGIEAMLYGCVMLNPTYTEQEVRKNRGRGHGSQHGFLEDYVGGERVCTVDYADDVAVDACLSRDTLTDGLLVEEFTREAYERRVVSVFGDIVRNAAANQGA